MFGGKKVHIQKSPMRLCIIVNNNRQGTICEILPEFIASIHLCVFKNTSVQFVCNAANFNQLCANF